MRVAFVDLKRQNRIYRNTFLHLFSQTLDDSAFLGGLAIEQFEKEFSNFYRKKYCIRVNSDTDAILFSLFAYGVGPGDDMISASNSYFSPEMMISQIGSSPVFVDFDTQSTTVDVFKTKNTITKKTCVIIPVHLSGQPADADAILALADNYRLTIAEDACQGHEAMSEKLSHLGKRNQKQRNATMPYNKLLKGIPRVLPPNEIQYAYHIYHLYMIGCECRDAFANN